MVLDCARDCEDLLAAAGFAVQPANAPEGVAPLRSLANEQAMTADEPGRLGRRIIGAAAALTVPAALPSGDAPCPIRRAALLAPLLAVLAGKAQGSPINPAQTAVTLPDAIAWGPWNGAPPGSAEVATLYGGLDKPGPYLVMMRWHPGYMSAPHLYATDRLSLVLSGTWWVDSGADFDPSQTVAVPPGSFVRRVAHTPHYDGVRQGGTEPAVVALFGIAPVDFEAVDVGTPVWRRV